jgi:hypothetical protein
MGEGSLEANLKDLDKYGLRVNMLGLEVMTSAGKAFTSMAHTTGGAFEKFTDGGVFAEATVVTGLLNHHMSDFRQFLADVAAGMKYTGAAARVIAACYSETDLESGASLDDIGFAFGDAGVGRPKGLPKDAGTQTFSQEAAAAGDGGGQPMSLSGDPLLATHEEYHPGYVCHFFPDGSTMTVTTKRVSNPPYADEIITETVICDASGKVLQRGTQSDASVYGGYKVSTTTKHNGDADQGVDVKTVVTTDPHGNETIETTTTGPDGKPTTTTTTVAAGKHDDPGGTAPGPVQQAEDRYGTDGDAGTLKHYGPGH